jgi:hypothetical protein
MVYILIVDLIAITTTTPQAIVIFKKHWYLSVLLGLSACIDSLVIAITKTQLFNDIVCYNCGGWTGRLWASFVVQLIHAFVWIGFAKKVHSGYLKHAAPKLQPALIVTADSSGAIHM